MHHDHAMCTEFAAQEYHGDASTIVDTFFRVFSTAVQNKVAHYYTSAIVSIVPFLQSSC